jgi:hypothetical protein
MTNRRSSDRNKRRAKPAVTTEPTRLTLEQAAASSSANQGDGAGILRPQTGDPHLPSGLSEPKRRIWSERPSGVVLTIVGWALIWIVIVAYFVSQMPP